MLFLYILFPTFKTLQFYFEFSILQGDQLSMTVCFWNLVAFTNATSYQVTEQHGHVYLVKLYSMEESTMKMEE